jgi:hypothetical protein
MRPLKSSTSEPVSTLGGLTKFYDRWNTDGPSFFPWLVQQFCVPLIAFFCLSATEIALRSLSPGITPPPRLTEDVWEMVVAWGVGFLLAVLANRFIPRWAADGRFTWILPSAILIMAICAELSRKGPPEVVSGFFYPDNKNEENLVFSLATLPTYSCIAYSLGILLARARFGSKGSKGTA